MDWESKTFWMIDDGYGTPAASFSEHNGVPGYLILVFTDRQAVKQYAYHNVPRFDERRIRELTRKNVGDRMLQVDLLRYIRGYDPEKNTYPILGMMINAGTLNLMIPTEVVVTHGLTDRREDVVDGVDELFGDDL